MFSSLTPPSINEPIAITANSTEYLATVHFINDKGQTKVIPGKDFKKLTFESSYFTPFMRGKLQLDNTNELSTASHHIVIKYF